MDNSMLEGILDSINLSINELNSIKLRLNAYLTQEQSIIETEEPHLVETYELPVVDTEEPPLDDEDKNIMILEDNSDSDDASLENHIVKEMVVIKTADKLDESSESVECNSNSDSEDSIQKPIFEMDNEEEKNDSVSSSGSAVEEDIVVEEDMVVEEDIVVEEDMVSDETPLEVKNTHSEDNVQKSLFEEEVVVSDKQNIFGSFFENTSEEPIASEPVVKATDPFFDSFFPSTKKEYKPRYNNTFWK